MYDKIITFYGMLDDEDADEFVVELFEDPELYGIGYEEYNMFFL